ncbi:WSC domain-containing protein [Coprinopsis cinerea okayama7|uniref:WSC domain-containing protein n=1 Tax=Coprinopsis cinerea (strain Okayama-7 / 130 / ATCC MYA-4618 / FGSC 9003) TaxID=240176 RepID=A8P8A0_COPC7|nr:WSC domain-containing protein [Coprinopsis cinerea okayama7\|eukprot:XP_001839528.2 WSC domain-containing protein [Coprinopsis cinerea okayama7\
MIRICAIVSLLTTVAHGLLRFPCSQLVTQRFDPLVTPGQVSPHVHQIVGGNAFNLTMDPDLDLPNLATCTTCRFKEDKSNYWTAVMYFKHPNGSFIRASFLLSHLEQYLKSSGFRMVVGNPMLRSDKAFPPNSSEAYALTFRCWETEDLLGYSNLGAPGTGAYDTINLPNRPCPAGIRANIFFPSCWDGVNLDSPDHRSHVAFLEGPIRPEGGLFFREGTCPYTHPVRIPLLFYEVYWDTRPFNSLWPEDDSQPFVLSMGDPTGYGHHGDYVFGWEGDSLQRAMDICTDVRGRPTDCTELTVLSDDEINSCTQEPQVDEIVEGQYLPELPGCNPIQHGPAPAIPIDNCDAVSTTGFGSATRALRTLATARP